MSAILDTQEPLFQQHELVTLHNYNGNKRSLIPAVVLGLENGKVIVKARIDGKIEICSVDPDQLVSR